MTKREELRAEILRLNGVLDELEKKRDQVESERSKLVVRLQEEECPHERVVELAGEQKYPGEKTISVRYRVCLDCGYPEGHLNYRKLISPPSLVSAKFSDRHEFEVLGRKLR